MEASGGSTASHAGPGWLGALLSPHQSWGVCGRAPSTHCCPPFRPSVTVTVPFAVTASCKKAIKSACARMLWPLRVSAPRALHVPAGIHYGPPLRDWGQDVLSPSCCGTQSPGSLSHQTQHWENTSWVLAFGCELYSSCAPVFCHPLLVLGSGTPGHQIISLPKLYGCKLNKKPSEM